MDTAANNATKSESGELSHADLLRSAVEQGFAEAPESVNPEAAEHAAATETTKPDAKEAAKSGEATQDKANEQAKPEDAKKSERDAKSEDRAKRTWEEINAEKARLAEERKQLEQAKALKTHKPEDYEAIAKEYEGEGRDDLAKVARQRAAEIRVEQERAKAAEATAEFTRKRDADIRELTTQIPELMDPGTELFQTVEALIKRKPILMHYPSGFRDAVETAQALMEAKTAKAMAKELGELKQKLSEYEAKLQPGIGGPSSASRSVNFGDLSPAEQRTRLIAELKTAEASGQGLFQ